MPSPLGRRAAVGLLVAATLGMGFAAPAAAQQATGSVRGRITDAVTGQPLAGAQISVRGTRLGAVTDANGTFLIRGVPAGAVVVRMEDLGFAMAEKPATVAAGEAITVDGALAQQAIQLNELVVTGTPGATQKRAVGNSVAQVKAAQITAVAPTENVQQLLTANTPGVTLAANAGSLGASQRIRIRGAGSINAGVDPVVYVDGVRFSSNTQGGFSVSNGLVQGTSPLDAINPEDIESIEVIKGPAAATLYGADAANGVIQIITKKGRSDNGIRWNMSYDQGNLTWALPQPVNYTLCGAPHAKSYPGCAGQPSTFLIEQTPLTKDPTTGDSYIRQGSLSNLNLSASGGGQAYTFYLSGERNAETGVMLNNFTRRTVGRANFSVVPSEKLNFNVSAGYSDQHLRMPLANNASNGILRVSWRGRPGASYAWRDGFLGLDPQITNQYDNQTTEERTTFGLTVNANPFPWFSNRLTVGMDKNDRVNTVLYSIDTTGKQPWGGTDANGSVYQLLPVDHQWTVDYAGTVNNAISKDYSSAFSMGLQYNKHTYHSREADGIGFVSDKVNTVSSAATTQAYETFWEQNSLGFFAQEMVGRKDRLFGTAAVRVDNNSAFGSQVNLVVYPKASLSYVISDERWFHLPAVDQLKLRLAWGRAGRAPAPFTADRTYSGRVATLPSATGDVSVNQVEPLSYGNENLKAETGDEIEAGFEAGLLQSRLGLDFTYYSQHTRDALMSIPDPRSAGFTGTHYANIGEIANSGLELAVTATPVYTRSVRWQMQISAATNHNKLVSFGNDQTSIDFGAFATVQRHIPGYPLGGLWEKDVVRDASGNPVVTRNSSGMYVATVEDSMHYVGPILPTRTVGFSNTVTILDNVKLYAHLDYSGGNYQWCAMCSIRARVDHNNFADNQPLLTQADSINYAVLTSLETRKFISPADFLKLREISLTYTLPARLSRGFGARDASLTLAARNLWMWSRYDGLAGKGKSDPETVFYSQDAFDATDYASVPMLRRLLATVRVSF